VATQTRLPDARTAGDELFSVIDGITAIDAFHNEVGDVNFDEDGKVHGYAVLWTGNGVAEINRLCATPDSKSWIFQVTAAGGDVNRASWVSDKVVKALAGLRLSNSTPINQILDSDRVQKDTTVDPARYYFPLLFGCRLALEDV
jgi:hypothetical protein